MKRKVIKRLKRKVKPYKHTIGYFALEYGYKFNRETREYDPFIKMVYRQERC